MRIFSPFYKRPPKREPVQPSPNRDVMIKASSSEKISSPAIVQSSLSSNQITNIRKLCSDYKVKYLAKNRENLEYEKKLIHMNGQLERLKLDLTYEKEQNGKLQERLDQLEDENRNLKIQLESQRQNFLDDLENNNDPEEEQSATPTEYKIHETFICSKAILQDKINQLRNELHLGRDITSN